MTKSTTVAEATNIKKEIMVQAPTGPIWRYFLQPSPEAAADFANVDPAQHGGEAVFSVRDDGQTDTFLFF